MLPLRIVFASCAMFVGLNSFCGFGQSDPPEFTFNKNFPGGALGKVQALPEGSFRCYVPGQVDEHGRNRQANWYYFRLGATPGAKVTVILTDFVGEYDNKPGACPMSAETIPVFSYDNEHWQHFSSMKWDNKAKEATLNFSMASNAIWIAHTPPYTESHLNSLLRDLVQSSSAHVEVFGKSSQGRDLNLVTITSPSSTVQDKKVIWIQARQHAWESGTSFVMDGALRFLISNDDGAAQLRNSFIFYCIPTLDPDGIASGQVRFNANGFDLNRHWNQVNLRSKADWNNMPEICYAKKALLSTIALSGPILLALNLHNTETGEYMESSVDDPQMQERIRSFYSGLTTASTFDPSANLRFTTAPDTTMNSLWQEHRIPVVLIEQRISKGKKLGRLPTVDDRRQFGRDLMCAFGSLR